MNTLKRLWDSIATLAASLNGLAATADAFSDQVRQRAGLAVDTEPLPLPEGNGEAEPAALPAARKRRTPDRA